MKTARKGTGDYFVRIKGRAAHAGVEPQKGISATQELAHQILTLHALNDYDVGTTINVGVVQAGTRPNVIGCRPPREISRSELTINASRSRAAVSTRDP